MAQDDNNNRNSIVSNYSEPTNSMRLFNIIGE